MKINKECSVRIKICVVMLVMCASLVAPGDKAITAEFRDRIYGMMTKLCPSADICRGPADEEPIEPPATLKSCCYDCSCSGGCCTGHNLTCCFPLTDSDRSLQECVYPGHSARGPTSSEAFYYMVTKRPTPGCVTNDVTDDIALPAMGKEGSRDELSQKDAGYLSPLDFLEDVLPVSSPSSGLIYKNPVLASCHGVEDGITWSPEITCFNDDKPIDVMTMANFFETHMGNDCAVKFKESGSRVFKSQRCFDGFIHSCNSNTNLSIPNYIEATHEDIIFGCESGLVAPYKGYANVFCYLCSECTLPDFGFNFCFDTTSTQPSMSFYALIDTSAASRWRSNRRRVKRRNGHMACDVENETDCRAVHCPSGQVRTDVGCKWLFSSPSGGSITMLLELSTDVPPDECTKLPEIYSWELLEMLVSPWPDEWRIYLLMKELKQSQDNVTECPHLAVEIRHAFAASFDNVIKQYQDYIGYNWTLNYNNATVQFKQSLMRWSDIVVNANGSGQPRWTHMLENGSLLPSHPGYRRIYKRGGNAVFGTLPVTKTWFCEQILLEQTEYTLFASDRVLFQNRTNTYLFESEFSLLTANQQYRPRICLSNSTFRKRDITDAAGRNHFVSEILLLLYFVMELFI